MNRHSASDVLLCSGGVLLGAAVLPLRGAGHRITPLLQLQMSLLFGRLSLLLVTQEDPVRSERATGWAVLTSIIVCAGTRSLRWGRWGTG